MERFLDESPATAADDRSCLTLGAVTAGKDHGDIRIDLPQDVERPATVYPRHDHIQDDQIDLLCLLAVYGDRLLTAAGRQHPIAVVD